MIEVIVDSVRVSLTNQQRIVVLREANGQRYLPIWIGLYEAEAITIAVQKIQISRPQTHDLLWTMIQRLGGLLRRVEISAIIEDVFYANLVIEQDGIRQDVDCRSSDALALAVRANVPIFVDDEVLSSVGVIPDVDADGMDADDGDELVVENDTDAGVDEDLSVFEDFLKNLNPDDENTDTDNLPI